MGRTHHTEAQPERADVYTRITQEIVAAIECALASNGDAKLEGWTLPWHHDGSDLARPLNIASKARYRGVNVLALWVAAMKFGYPSGLWGTYRQFAAAGAQVRKGERATTVVFWKQFRNGGQDDDANEASGVSDAGTDERDDGHGRPRFMARGYSVFNAAQVDGLDQPAQPVLPECERIAHAERFFSNTRIPIRTEGDQACYVPSLDVVRMPPFARFRSAEAFYATLGHECGHATGAKHRLDRDLGGRFGSERYAVDEHIAELTSSFVMADLGLACGARPESTAYLASWLKVLKNDTRAIFTAASKAQAAADWMHAQQPGAAQSPIAEDASGDPAESQDVRDNDIGGDAVIAAAA
jgi:antirestriction protein ArdC